LSLATTVPCLLGPQSVLLGTKGVKVFKLRKTLTSLQNPLPPLRLQSIQFSLLTKQK